MEDHQDLEKLLEQLRRVEEAVEVEYAENDRRLTWFLIFQAFLFQAYATALQALASSTVQHLDYVRFYVWIMCAVGAITAALTGVGTSAGVIAVHQLKRARKDKLQPKAEEKGMETFFWFGTRTWLHWLGLLPTLVFPWLLLVVWLWLIVRALDAGVAIWPFAKVVS